MLSLHLVKENVIAIIYSNRNIDFWDISDISNLKVIKRRDAHSGPILSLSMSSDDSVLTNSKDGTLCVWEIENKDNQPLIGLRKKLMFHTERSVVVEASRIHGLVVYGNEEGIIKLLKEKDLSEEYKLDSHNSAIKSIKFTGNYLGSSLM